MGIIKKIKEMFAKNIDCSNDLNDCVFHYYTKKNRVVTVGANIIVPDGYSAIFVCRDKITDVLPQGKFAITAATMPKTFNRLKLLKANKSGKLPKNFKSDIYFICVNEAANFKFASFNPYLCKDRKYGKVKANCEGVADIKIKEPEIILDYFLKERAFITDDLFLELLGGIIGDIINKKLMSSNSSFYDILTSPQLVYNILNDGDINTQLNEYGVTITNIKLESMNVKEKLQKKVEQDLRENRQFITEFNNNFENKINEPNDPIYNKQVQSNMSIENTATKNDIGYSICPKCGQCVNRGANFCEKCGINLTKIF